MSHCNSLCACAGLGFFLNGMLLSNNSIVLLRDIGEGSNALFCLTDRSQCCSNGQRRGAWVFPDGTLVTDTNGFYLSRGLSSLHLNRRINAMGPTGIFKCEIPDQANVLMNMYIGVYDDAGEGVLEMHRFLCMSYLYLHYQVHSLHHCPMIPHHIL